MSDNASASTHSVRAARRLLLVARTIADLEREPRFEAAAMAEALGYRREGTNV